MSFIFKCTNCGNQLRAEEEWIGRQGMCPSCKAKFIVQDPCSEAARMAERGIYIPSDSLQKNETGNENSNDSAKQQKKKDDCGCMAVLFILAVAALVLWLAWPFVTGCPRLAFWLIAPIICVVTLCFASKNKVVIVFLCCAILFWGWWAYSVNSSSANITQEESPVHQYQEQTAQVSGSANTAQEASSAHQEQVINTEQVNINDSAATTSKTTQKRSDSLEIQEIDDGRTVVLLNIGSFKDWDQKYSAELSIGMLQNGSDPKKWRYFIIASSFEEKLENITFAFTSKKISATYSISFKGNDYDQNDDYGYITYCYVSYEDFCKYFIDCSITSVHIASINALHIWASLDINYAGKFLELSNYFTDNANYKRGTKMNAAEDELLKKWEAESRQNAQENSGYNNGPDSIQESLQRRNSQKRDFSHFY